MPVKKLLRHYAEKIWNAREQQNMLEYVAQKAFGSLDDAWQEPWTGEKIEELRQSIEGSLSRDDRKALRAELKPHHPPVRPKPAKTAPATTPLKAAKNRTVAEMPPAERAVLKGVVRRYAESIWNEREQLNVLEYEAQAHYSSCEQGWHLLPADNIPAVQRMVHASLDRPSQIRMTKEIKALCRKQ